MTRQPTSTGHARPAYIPDGQIVSVPAEAVRAGDVTLYGVVLGVDEVFGEVQLYCWGEHTVTAAPGDPVTLVGRVSGAMLTQLRAQVKWGTR